MSDVFDPYAYLNEEKVEEGRGGNITIPEQDLARMMHLLDELHKYMASDQQSQYKILFNKYWQSL